jgi:NO-binding membrane sensor protein with MHYT domain
MASALSGVHFTGNHALTLNKDGWQNICTNYHCELLGKVTVNIAENTTIYNNIGNGG